MATCKELISSHMLITCRNHWYAGLNFPDMLWMQPATLPWIQDMSGMSFSCLLLWIIYIVPSISGLRLRLKMIAQRLPSLVHLLWFSLSSTSSLHFIPLGPYSFAYLHKALLVFLIFLSILRYDSLWLVFTSRLHLPLISALLMTPFHHEAAPPLCLLALWLVPSIIRLALDPIVYLYKPL